MTGAGDGLEGLFELILRTRHEGARAARLLRYTPELVNRLVSREAHPGLTDRERADLAEGMFRQVLDRIGEEEKEKAAALRIYFCLAPGTQDRNLTDRRALAGQQLGMDGETFRKPHHERKLVYDFTFEIDRARKQENGGT